MKSQQITSCLFPPFFGTTSRPEPREPRTTDFFFINFLIHDVCSVSVLITIKTLLGQFQMLTTHFISQWYLQKEPPKMLSRLAKSFPLVEIQDGFGFFFCQTIQGFVSKRSAI